MAKIKIDKKSLQVYNILQKLDVVKNVNKGMIKDYGDWKQAVNLIFKDVYNDKD
tara:strand:- start:302 stop:463 length:162 start_codon:yes stop_codon:yes gene_type:complete